MAGIVVKTERVVRGTGNRLIAMKIRTDSVFGGQFFVGGHFCWEKRRFRGYLTVGKSLDLTDVGRVEYKREVSEDLPETRGFCGTKMWYGRTGRRVGDTNSQLYLCAGWFEGCTGQEHSDVVWSSVDCVGGAGRFGQPLHIAADCFD